MFRPSMDNAVQNIRNVSHYAEGAISKLSPQNALMSDRTAITIDSSTLSDHPAPVPAPANPVPISKDESQVSKRRSRLDRSRRSLSGSSDREAKSRLLVDYSHNRAPLDRSSSYRIRRMGRRTAERSLSQPEAAATLRQERRMSALKAQKRRFSKSMEDSPGANSRIATRRSLSMPPSQERSPTVDISTETAPMDTAVPEVGSLDFYRVRLGMDASSERKSTNAATSSSKCDSQEKLQFSLKKSIRSGRTSSVPPSSRRQQHGPDRLPPKSKSSSDTMPRRPSRSASRRQLSFSAASEVALMVDDSQSSCASACNDRLLVASTVSNRLAESFSSLVRKSPTTASMNSKSSIWVDGFNTPAATHSYSCSCSGSGSGSGDRSSDYLRGSRSGGSLLSSGHSGSRRKVRVSLGENRMGGVFKSMALPKLKMYEHLDDEDEEDNDKGIGNKNAVVRSNDLPLLSHLPASLRIPRLVRVSSADDVSDCSSVTTDVDDEDDEEVDDSEDSIISGWEAEADESMSLIMLPGIAGVYHSHQHHDRNHCRRPSLMSAYSGSGSTTSSIISMDQSTTSSRSLRSTSSRRRRRYRRMGRRGSVMSHSHGTDAGVGGTHHPMPSSSGPTLHHHQNTARGGGTGRLRRSSVLVSHYASTSLLDSSFGAAGVELLPTGRRRRRSSLLEVGTNNPSYTMHGKKQLSKMSNNTMALVAFPTKIRRFAPSQA